MNEIKAMFNKAKDYITANYSSEGPINKFDWMMIGIGIGATLCMAHSIVLTIAVFAILAHHSYKRS